MYRIIKSRVKKEKFEAVNQRRADNTM